MKRKRLTRDQQTTDLINDAIREGDLQELRRLACVRGLVSPALRTVAWPLLLGVQPTADEALQDMLGDAPGSRAARDRQTISNDVARCLHESHIGNLEEGERAHLRTELSRLLTAVVDAEHVFYFQGLHEIAAVILLQVGTSRAFPLLRRLVCTQLRDCTRSSLDAVAETLQLIHPILYRKDPRLAAHLRNAQLPPYFALSWLITWFAHNVPAADTPRLFDVFLAAHPLMPLYLYLAAVLHVRKKLLTLDTMEDMHTFLVNFNPFSTALTIDQLVIAAVALIRDCPPDVMRSKGRLRIVHSCVIEARLVNDAWAVPEAPTPQVDLFRMTPLTATVARAFVGPAAVLCVAIAVGAAFWQTG